MNLKEPRRRMYLKDYDGQSIFYWDPYELTNEVYEGKEFSSVLKDSELILYLVSFGGCAWPLYYVTPIERYNHDDTEFQAVQNLYLTPEGESYRVTQNDEGLYMVGDRVEDWVEDSDVIHSDEGFGIILEDVAVLRPLQLSEIVSIQWHNEEF